ADGRDHNPEGFTVWLAGGGVKPGFRYGETDDYGWFAARDKVHIHDLHATMLHLLGLDHERLTYRYAGRDFRLTDVHGKVVKEVMASCDSLPINRLSINRLDPCARKRADPEHKSSAFVLTDKVRLYGRCPRCQIDFQCNVVNVLVGRSDHDHHVLAEVHLRVREVETPGLVELFEVGLRGDEPVRGLGLLRIGQKAMSDTYPPTRLACPSHP